MKKKQKEAQTIGNVLQQIIENQGWGEKIAFERIKNKAHDYFGAAANHIVIKKLENSILYISCESSSWRAEIKLRENNIVEKINEKFGKNTVNELKIR